MTEEFGCPVEGPSAHELLDSEWKEVASKYGNDFGEHTQH